MKTKAAVLYEAKSPLVMEELDLDPPKEGEVLVKIGAAGICRSDWHYMAGESYMPLPAVLGHEGSGVVKEVGPGVTSVKPGDPVILSFVSRCGRCHFCTIGRPNLCDAHMATSTTMLDGTYRLHKGETNITPNVEAGLLLPVFGCAGGRLRALPEGASPGQGGGHRLLRNHGGGGGG